MKKILWICLLAAVSGCASVSIPSYIKDKYPTEKIFYVSFDRARESTIKVFEKRGWVIEKESRPGLYELETKERSQEQQTLLFTNVRVTRFFVGSRYVRFNAYIRQMADKSVTIELRYAAVTSLPLKRFEDYKNDRAVKKIFEAIQKELNS